MIGGQIDRISDDVGEVLVDQRDFLLICPQCHSSEVALSPKRFSSEVTPGKSSTLTRFLQNERFVTGDTEL